MKTHWQRYSIDELRARARNELKINPTITVYDFINGVEYRRHANQFAGLNNVFGTMTGAFTRLTATMRDTAITFEKFTQAYREKGDS